jgi:hypothetical protein
LFAYAGNVSSELYVCKFKTVIEGLYSEAGDAVTNHHTAQFETVAKSCVANTDDTIWYCHAGQAGAPKESPVSNTGHAGGDYDFPQTEATPESRFSDGLDWISFDGFGDGYNFVRTGVFGDFDCAVFYDKLVSVGFFIGICFKHCFFLYPFKVS